MKVSMNDEFLNLFPEGNIQVLVARGLENIPASAQDRWRDLAREHVLNSRLDREHLGEAPEFREWRDAYSKFGLKPSKFRSSVEALWKRALKGDVLATPVPAVNLYCYVSLISRAPLGSYDLERINGDIVVRRSLAGESFLGIGESAEIAVSPGTVVYADDSRVISFGWNHRDSGHVCLQPQTRHAVFFADSALSSSRKRAEESIDLLQKALEEAGCSVVLRGTVDKRQQQLALSME